MSNSVNTCCLGHHQAGTSPHLMSGPQMGPWQPQCVPNRIQKSYPFAS